MSTKREKVVVAMSGGVDSSVAACLLKEQGYDVIGLFMRVGAEEPKPVCSTSGGMSENLGGMPKPKAPACVKNTDQHAHASVGMAPNQIGSGKTLADKPPVAHDDPNRESVNQSEPGAQATGLNHTASALEPRARAWGSENSNDPSSPRGLPINRDFIPPAAQDSLDTPTREHQGCCSASDAADARFVAGMLDIPFFALNFQEDFNEIIDYFADEYALGRTPNPCVVCNDKLKFGKLVDYADAVGAKYIATGHYARLDRRSDRNVMLRGVDHNKDQSYVLFGLNRHVLDRIMFPIGDLVKSEVRDIARKYNLPNQDKPDSVDICFVPDRNYARVVKKRRPDAFQEGDVVDMQGKVVGKHKGIGQYTIGQRRGLGIAAGKPIYVTNLNVINNTVTVGDSDALLCGSLIADRVNKLTDWPDGAFRAQVKIRYLHKAVDATIYPVEAGDDTEFMCGVSENSGGESRNLGGMPKPKAPACDTNTDQHAHATHSCEAWSMAPSHTSSGKTLADKPPVAPDDPNRESVNQSEPGAQAMGLNHTASALEPRDRAWGSEKNDSKVRVVFDEPQRAVTPGQAVVFYDGDLVLGGAWIERAEDVATVQALAST